MIIMIFPVKKYAFIINIALYDDFKKVFIGVYIINIELFIHNKPYYVIIQVLSLW